MKTFETPMGILYTEEAEYDRHKPFLREEEWCLKIFDSDKKYLDYFDIGLLQEYADFLKTDINGALKIIFDNLSKITNIENFLEKLGLDYEFISDNPHELKKYMRSIGMMNGLDSKWVNHIGKYWILIA